jgi:hypothetical protein
VGIETLSAPTTVSPDISGAATPAAPITRSSTDVA